MKGTTFYFIISVAIFVLITLYGLHIGKLNVF